MELKEIVLQKVDFFTAPHLHIHMNLWTYYCYIGSSLFKSLGADHSEYSSDTYISSVCFQHFLV